MGQRWDADKSQGPRAQAVHLPRCEARRVGPMAQVLSVTTLVTRHEAHQRVPGCGGLSQVRHPGPLTPCSSQGKHGRSPHMSRRCRLVPAGVLVSLYTVFPCTGLKDPLGQLPNPQHLRHLLPKAPTLTPGELGPLDPPWLELPEAGSLAEPHGKPQGCLTLDTT